MAPAPSRGHPHTPSSAGGRWFRNHYYSLATIVPDRKNSRIKEHKHIISNSYKELFFADRVLKRVWTGLWIVPFWEGWWWKFKYFKCLIVDVPFWECRFWLGIYRKEAQSWKLKAESGKAQGWKRESLRLKARRPKAQRKKDIFNSFSSYCFQLWASFR